MDSLDDKTHNLIKSNEEKYADKENEVDEQVKLIHALRRKFKFKATLTAKPNITTEGVILDFSKDKIVEDSKGLDNG